MPNADNQRNGGKYKEFPQVNSPHLQAIMECMIVCIACSVKCIEEGHKKTAILCAECADVCDLAIKSASSQSEFNNHIMELCAQVCQRCAEECRKMQVQHCIECAEACNQCAEACSTAQSMS